MQKLKKNAQELNVTFQIPFSTGEMAWFSFTKICKNGLFARHIKTANKRLKNACLQVAN